jgi:hypothetical protein
MNGALQWIITEEKKQKTNNKKQKTTTKKKKHKTNKKSREKGEIKSLISGKLELNKTG